MIRDEVKADTEEDQLRIGLQMVSIDLFLQGEPYSSSFDLFIVQGKLGDQRC